VSNEILVVDDEADLRFVARLMLETAGYSVDEAATGEEGLAKVGEEKPCLVLLDIRLPGIDGLEVLRRVRSDDDLDEVRVVMMSAHTSPETFELASEVGSDGYLVKPFREDDLLRTAEEFCRRS
jgi:DNA-binding response OmpR family regulator